jgi:hypothetical protein
MKTMIALATAILISSGAAASAQVMAPGPALPGNASVGGLNPGGIGPGMSSVAPGPSTGSMIQNVGPGGVPLAIGSHDSTLRSLNRSVR